MTSDSASRVTRSSRSLRLAILAFAGVLAVATALRAQETPPADAPREAGPAPVQAEPPASDAPASDATTSRQPAATDAAAAPAPPASAPASSPARFEPTEKVRADFDVSFPIDI